MNQFQNWMGDPDDAFSSSDTEDTQSPARSSDYFVSVPGQNLVPCAAKLIVGADGINSVARRCVYRYTCPAGESCATAVYSGQSMLGYTAPPGVIPERHQLSLDYAYKAKFVLHTCNPDVVKFDTLHILLMHNDNNSKSRIDWGIVYHMPIDEHTARNASDTELQRYIIDKTRNSGFSEDIISLSTQIWESSESATFRRPYSIVPATHPPSYQLHPAVDKVDYPDDSKRPWYYGRVVLAGDAAHGNPPMLGQGAAMGLEDVYVLMEALSSRGIWSGERNSRAQKEGLQEAFEYYARRVDRVCFLQKYVMNRISEYDIEAQQVREKLWSYSTNSVKRRQYRVDNGASYGSG